MFELGDQRPRQETSATPRRTILRAAGLLGLTGAGAAALGACADASSGHTCFAGRSETSTPPPLAVTDCRRDILQAVSVNGEGPRGPKCRYLQGAGRRWRDLGERRLRGHPTEQGRVQGVQQDLHPPGMPGGIRRQRVIHCNCHGSEYSIEDGSTNPPATKVFAEAKTDRLREEGLRHRLPGADLGHFASRTLLASPADSAASK